MFYYIFATSGAIKRIQVTFPVGTTVPSSASFNEAEGIRLGAVSKSGQTITYTVNNAVNIPAGTLIRLEFSNINNPLNPSANYNVTVTTRNTANAIIDGPTQSTAYTMKQIGANVIADNSITSTKPAESFMKGVTLSDNTAGNALGWNPGGVQTEFFIAEPSVSGIVSSYVDVWVHQSTVLNCQVTFMQSGAFVLLCETPPANGATLHYKVENLPAHVVQ